jgi:hypothetical protein
VQEVGAGHHAPAAQDRGRLVPDALLRDLGIPSLDLVQAIFAIEERFKVDIPVASDRTGAKFQTGRRTWSATSRQRLARRQRWACSQVRDNRAGDTSRRRVAITDLTAIYALGSQVPEIWAAMQARKCGIAPITGIPTNRLSASAAQVPGFDPLAHFGARRAPMLDRGGQLAVVAAREATRWMGFACCLTAWQAGLSCEAVQRATTAAGGRPSAPKQPYSACRTDAVFGAPC